MSKNIYDELLVNVLTYNEVKELERLDIFCDLERIKVHDFELKCDPLKFIKDREFLKVAVRNFTDTSTEVKHPIGDIVSYNILDKCIRLSYHSFTGDDSFEEAVVCIKNAILRLQYTENLCRDILNRIDRLSLEQRDVLIKQGDTIKKGYKCE